MLWMLGTLTSFCLMAVAVRELSGQINTFQVLFFRSAIGLFVISLIIAITRNITLFKTHRMPLHLMRNFFHFGGQYGWFLGIGLLPLAEVFALEFTVPLWTAIIAYFFLKEKFTLQKLTSIILGVLGVVVIVQPGREILHYASLIVLGAAICYAISHASTKSLSSTENTLTILFLMCLIQLPIGLFFTLFYWQAPTDIQWLWLIVIGITALSANYCMAQAMRYTEVTAVVTMDFLRLPLIAIVGVALYSENIEISLFLGALLMLLGNLLNIYAPKQAK